MKIDDTSKPVDFRKEFGSTCSEYEEGKIILSPQGKVENPHYTDMDILEIKVRKEIEEKGLDYVLDKALLGEDVKDHKTKKYVQDRQKKNKKQIRVLTQELADVIKKGKHMTRSHRMRIGQKIGLTENQVYKWYYDNIKNQHYEVKLDWKDSESSDDY